jgi:hypothetical protein
MTMNAQRRNELDRAKHTKATRVTLYELGILIAVLNVADKLAGIWAKYSGLPLEFAGIPLAKAVTLAIGLIFAIPIGFMVFMRWSDGRLFASLEEELDELAKDAAQTEGSS